MIEKTSATHKPAHENKESSSRSKHPTEITLRRLARVHGTCAKHLKFVIHKGGRVSLDAVWFDDVDQEFDRLARNNPRIACVRKTGPHVSLSDPKNRKLDFGTSQVSQHEPRERIRGRPRAMYWQSSARVFEFGSMGRFGHDHPIR